MGDRDRIFICKCHRGKKPPNPQSRSIEEKNSPARIVLGLIQLIRRAQLRQETSLLPILYAGEMNKQMGAPYVHTALLSVCFRHHPVTES